MKRNEGFTLVELLVSFTVGAIVALAATSVLLLGLRFNAISGGTAQRQNTTRILLTVFENLATEQQIHSVDYTYDSWKINGGKNEAGNQTNQVLLHYDLATQAIYSGEKPNNDDTPSNILLDGVIASHVILDDNGLLSFYVETEDGSYSSSIYCRKALAPSSIEGTDIDKKVDELIKSLQNSSTPTADFSINGPRTAFLSVLVDEIGSTGKIVGGTQYYSEWYIGGYTDNSWNKDTPWCACYVSWALCQPSVEGHVTKPTGRDNWYADVDEFILCFDIKRYGNADFNPQSGDIVFFDWDGGENPEHMGVVLAVLTDTNHKTFVYTIEGNSAGVVAVRKYLASDDRIIGYGVLPWT